VIERAWQDSEGLGDRLLNFLENHDEQRLASPFFAGDARMGRPGMAVCAGLTRGPVMVYFGQEVGEPGAGDKGYSGLDGRTTIFDYWGVPEHQKFQNAGAWDGGRLSAGQVELRQFYARLLGLCRRAGALAHGTVRFVPTGSERALAWYREYQGQSLFFAANFDRDRPLVLETGGRVLTVPPMDAVIPALE
jgi:glycosidase